MNKRIRKKKDKEAILIAKKIMWIEFLGTYPNGCLFWDAKSRITKKQMRYGERFYDAARYDFRQELIAKEMLLKVCRKCIKDGFPIEEYALFEIPYWDKNGWIMDFVHLDEHNDRNPETRQICFWCPYHSKIATAQKYDEDAKDCFDAVYTD